MRELKTLWKVAQFPLLVLFVVLILYVVWAFSSLPPREEVLVLLKGYIARWGFVTVLFGSFFEGLLLLGWYFPGSMLIFLSVALAPSPIAAAVSVGLVTVGLYTSYVVNFFLGKYGWYRLLLLFGVRRQLEDAQEKLIRFGARAIVMTYWHPTLASLTATAAGVLHYPPKVFLSYSLGALAGWNIFWGVLVYVLGEGALGIFLSIPFLFSVIALWIVARYVEEWATERRVRKTREDSS